MTVEATCRQVVLAHIYRICETSSLLPTKSFIPDQTKYKSFDKDWQLIFVKTNDKDPIKTIAKWTEAFHAFDKNTHGEIGNLML